MSRSKSTLVLQAAQVLRRARKLPMGSARNDLRQLAQGLISLHKSAFRANVRVIDKPNIH